MCYERRSNYENKKTVATEPKKQDTRREEVVNSLLKDAERAGQRVSSDAPLRNEPVPAK
jgi:hypothetical protein